MKIKIPEEKAYRLLNPGCVTLITSAYRDRVNIMTLAWHTPISIRPPLIGIAVAPGHFTRELIDYSEEFAINIPGANLLEVVSCCGTLSGRKFDKFKESGVTPVTAMRVRAPLVGECLGHVECGVAERYKLGDHYLFVGEVLAASVKKDSFSEHWKENVELIHHLGGKQYYLNGRREEAGK